ncbi:NUDIX hydrolase [Candidatus Woesearchaeota archaeon]|nr:MAG: NUDIX hydrolase [Candidatus Woesearchaeota archaeon]
MLEEHIEEIDWDGNVLAVWPRSELKKRLFPHNVSLIIPSENGKLLLAKRSANKHPFPGVWCCAVGGKALAGETPESCAYREMHEEIGTTVPLRHVVTANHKGPATYERLHIYTTAENLSADNIKIDPAEIEYLRHFALDELQTLVQKQPDSFAPAFLTALRAYVAAEYLK